MPPAKAKNRNLLAWFISKAMSERRRVVLTLSDGSTVEGLPARCVIAKTLPPVRAGSSRAKVNERSNLAVTLDGDGPVDVDRIDGIAWVS